jgi:FAD/FMN-containing dehydrogenase
VRQLNEYLQQRGRSLKTAGASNSQTIAGAFSTGTHGSAVRVGAMQDFVVGLHLIVGEDRHIWLERASYPVVSDRFIERLGAEPIRDDTLFNAALVSFGGFGIIHAAMIETEPIYLVEAHRQRVPLGDALKHTIDTLDFSEAPVPHPARRRTTFKSSSTRMI